MAYFAALLCENCSRPIPLPPAKHPCTSPHQPSWPTDCAPRNFLCRACKHVYEYSVQDVRQVPFGKTGQGQDRKSQNIVCIEIPCGAPCCAALIRVRTLMAFDADLDAEIPEILALSHGHQVRCDRGDILSGPIRPSGTNFSAHFDEGWERPGR